MDLLMRRCGPSIAVAPPRPASARLPPAPPNCPRPVPPPPCSAALAAARGEGLQRALTSYEPRYARFVVKARVYSQQYSHLYTRRLGALRPLVLEAAARRYGGAWRCRFDSAMR